MHNLSKTIDGLLVEYHHPIAEDPVSDTTQETLPSICVALPPDHLLRNLGLERTEVLLGHAITHYIRHEGTVCWIPRDYLQIYYREHWLEGLNDDERTEAIWAEAQRIVHQIQRMTPGWWERAQAARRALSDILSEVGRLPL